MPYTVYVLCSVNHNRHYTGYSSDFARRLQSHNELGTKGYTVRYRPWKVILIEEYADKQAAIAREKWLKSGVGRLYIKSLDH
jgi:putative endonuclease